MIINLVFLTASFLIIFLENNIKSIYLSFLKKDMKIREKQRENEKIKEKYMF